MDWKQKFSGIDRKRLLIAGGSMLALVLAIVLTATLYVMGGKGDGAGQDLFARLGNGLSAITQSLTPAPTAPAERFAFRRLEIDTTKAQAEACLVFTQDLDRSGRTNYQDYFSVDPQTRTAARVVDTRLCLAGLEFNKIYNVTLKTGLPAASGDKLTEDETVPVELRDKPSLVRFSGGIILPRENAAGVPVTTVNIAQLSIKVIRVGDRLLSQIESDTVDQTSVYNWDATQLENNQGAMVWQGVMDVANVKNDSVVTLIPLRDILKGKKPGAFVLIVRDAAKSKDEADYSTQYAAQWIVNSDIALTTFQGASGLTVFARSYATTRPMAGVRLTLVARNNNELASVTTNGDGRADFAPGLMRAVGGDEPVVVMAYGAGEDFSFLDLRRSAFDLTDRGVGGRASPGPVDAYVYTERGVYRPGETVQSVTLLRNNVAKAVTAPLTLVAQRPDGMEVSRTTIAGDKLLAGAATWTLPLNKTAPHGRWQIAAYIDPKAEAVGRVQFDVADFVPQRLRVTLTAQEQLLRPGNEFHLSAASQFLYGAPASDLSGDGEARIIVDGNPFPAHTGFRFGRVDDSFSDVTIPITVPNTDATGATIATGTIPELADTTLPLKALMKVSIHEPGGRTTDRTAEVPVRTRDVLIGLRADFENGSVAENSRAGFEAIALNASGQRVALSGLNFSWVREDTNYQWYQERNEWRYKSVTRDRLVTSGTMNIGAGASAKLAQAMPWGTYRLTITDPKSGAAASYRFYSGWAASSAGDRPDRIPVAADKPSYNVGETARINIKPTANGRALVVVAGDRVFSSQMVDAPASGATVNVRVSAEWGAGAYVLVTDYRPLNDATGREPVRSIGLTWLGVSNAPRTLSVLIGGPTKFQSRQRLTIPVTVKGLSSGEDAYLTVAAVDEGILQLTDFKSPDPTSYYYGKRRLGVTMRDDYGRLIKAEKGAVGSLREGGDSFGGRPLAVVPTRTVALFSGLVKIGNGGLTNISFDVPDFNGELRLMAVAVSGDKIGNAERALTVRDPVVAEFVLPRFLAPGDKAAAALNFNNVEGQRGNYVAIVRTTGPLALAGNVRQITLNRVLNAGQRALVPVTFEGQGIGIAGISLSVTGPGGFNVSRSWQIEVRAPQMDVARDETVPLAANAVYTANRALVSDIVGSTANISLNVSTSHGYSDVPGLLRWLDKYPYGCVEQLTSRAMPLLVFNDLADLAGLPRDQALRGRVQDAIDSVLDMQNYAGNFGLWGPGSDADGWISVFALDFLTQAKEKGYVVPADALARGSNWLKNAAASDSEGDATRAYAFYLLARSGQVNVSDLRYFSDTRGPEFNTAIAAALTGAAASNVGDRARSTYAFNKARDIAQNATPAGYPTSMYGSLLRDVAATIALAQDSGQAQLIPALMRKSDEINTRLNYTTTQDKAWMLRAAFALTRQRSTLDILVNNRPAPSRNGAVRLKPSLGQLDAGLRVLNRGDAVVWRTVSVQGTPSVPLPAQADGVTLSKTVWTISGSPADLSSLKQNDRVVILLSGRMPNNVYRQMGAVDLLPAGLEIESTLSGEEGKAYPFLGALTETNRSVAADDRFIAAFNIGARYRNSSSTAIEPQPEFRLAYVARAVTAGDFVMPAGVVEDMYAPAIRGRTTMGRVNIGQ